jgi:hypothetical protein
MIWRMLLIASLLFLPTLPSNGTATVIWYGAYMVDGNSYPMAGGHVVWLDRPHQQWVEGRLGVGGYYKAALPVGEIIPWVMVPPDDDTCWVLNPPTEQGPANQGVFYPLTTTQIIALKFGGECKDDR